MVDIQFTMKVEPDMMKLRNVIALRHYLHSSLEKSLKERVNQYFNDRIHFFDASKFLKR